MVVNFFIVIGLFWLSIWIIFILVLVVVIVDLCGFDEISDENFMFLLNFFSENKMKKDIECSCVILLKFLRVKFVVEELNIVSGVVLEI